MEPLYQLARVSARSFTMEETQKYAGSFHDPARMASPYAGASLIRAVPGQGQRECAPLSGLAADG